MVFFFEGNWVTQKRTIKGSVANRKIWMEVQFKNYRRTAN